jgi:flagellar hook-length control protein FliK
MRQPATAIPDAPGATGIEPDGAPSAARIALPPRAALEMSPGIATGPGQTTGLTEFPRGSVPGSDRPAPRISGDAGVLPQRIGPGNTQTPLRLTQASAPATPPLRADIPTTAHIAPEIGAMTGVEPLGSASAVPTQGGLAPAAAFAGTGTAMPQQIAQHIAASLPRPISDMGSGTLELALDPPELGRVRMTLVEAGGVMTLSIVADRPETVELMRRHMDILAQEFSRAGLDAPNVRVGTGWDGSGAAPDRDAAPPQRGHPEPGTDTVPGAPHAPAPWLPPNDPTRALDLRL